jgi:excisionase family DNA binding protein
VRRRPNISVCEHQRRASQRAMSIRDFCERYDVGRTTVHQEIKEGRLKARKAGRRTLIGDDDARAWWLALPTLNEALDQAASSTAMSGPKTARNASAPFEDTAMALGAEGEPDTPKTRQPGRRRANVTERMGSASMSKSGG